VRQAAPLGTRGTAAISEGCNAMQHESLLSIDEVAQQLRIHPDTVRRLLRTGRLKGIRKGTRGTAEWGIDPRDLAAFIEAGRQRRPER
jgi:excisionase family DNA binding protein